MDELGIDLSRHRPQTFEDLEDTSFDLIVTLSPEAHHRALEFTRTLAVDVVYWPTLGPDRVEGSRDSVLDAYRDVRDTLRPRIRPFRLATRRERVTICPARGSMAALPGQDPGGTAAWLFSLSEVARAGSDRAGHAGLGPRRGEEASGSCSAADPS